MAKNLFKIAKQKKIKYFLISFVDLFGVLRSKLVPVHAIKEMQTAGAGFAGFAAWLDMSPADSDMFGIPDPDSLIQLPWNKEVGWLASDLWMDGKPVEASPRVMLKNQIKKLKKQNLTMKSGVECEYFLISSDGNSIADLRDTQSKPCYDQSALMRRYDLIKEICDCMIEMEWGPYQNDHEDANGQFEMNWDYDDCLKTADRHTFFKYMVKTIAEKHGLRATFMPKPFENLTGNGCHAHISLWDGKLPPAWIEGGQGQYLLGTDNQGRDMLSTILYGGRLSIMVGLAAVCLGMVMGVSLGVIAGFNGGLIDSIIMRAADVQLTIPGILLAILINGIGRAALPLELREEFAIYVVIIAIGLTDWPQFARVARASALVEVEKEYC